MRDDGLEDAVLKDAIARRADLLRDRDPLRPRRGRRSTRCQLQREARRRLFALADEHGVALGRHRHAPAVGLPRAAHHRHRALPARPGRAAVRRAAQQHVRAAGARRRPGRATARSRSATACGPVLPTLLAISANSPFIDGRDSGLHSARTQTSRSRSRAAASRTSSGPGRRWHDYVELLLRHQLDRRVHPALVVGARRTTPSGRSRCASATPRRPAPRPTALVELIVGLRRRRRCARSTRARRRPTCPAA